MKAPSKAKLESSLCLTPEQATLIRKLIHQDVTTTDATLFPQSNAHFNACYNRPFYSERLMKCINEVMQGNGVEALGDSMNPLALYVNTGDTYSSTLLYSYKTKTIRLTTWGDFAESNNL